MVTSGFAGLGKARLLRDKIRFITTAHSTSFLCMWALKLQGNHCTIHAVYVRRTHMVQSLSFLAVQTESEESSVRTAQK